MQAQEGHFGVTWGSLRGDFGVMLGASWGLCGVILGSFWGRFGVIIINIIKSISALTFGRGFGGQVEAQNGIGEVEKWKNCESKRDTDLEAFLEAKLRPKMVGF